ncbi:MAG TPA: hypothetical protein VJ781_04035, partial [Pyrinomonadaceae bacterium]|nr:hypothetical protein [Pyrinomonadaceae bacterium]
MSIAYLPFDNNNDVLEAPRSGLTDPILKVWPFGRGRGSIPLILEAVIVIYGRVYIVPNFANFIINVCQPVTCVVAR